MQVDNPEIKCEILPKDKGPLKLKGNFVITDMDGNLFDLGGRTEISLCRCGQSEKKPFCDGQHKKLGFQSTVRAFALSPIPPKE